MDRIILYLEFTSLSSCQMVTDESVYTKYVYVSPLYPHTQDNVLGSSIHSFSLKECDL